MPDPIDNRTRTHRQARHRNTRPPRPPLDLVARDALALDPASDVAKYLAAVPEIADRVRRLHHLDGLAADLGVTEAERLAALRFGISTRTLRRWRRGL